MPFALSAFRYCSTPCLVRYLRARNWKLAPAEELLRDTVAWRQSYGVKALTPDDFAGEAASGKIYVHGNDRFGRPVIYQRPRRENTKDYLNQVRDTCLSGLFGADLALLRGTWLSPVTARHRCACAPRTAAHAPHPPPFTLMCVHPSIR